MDEEPRKDKADRPKARHCALGLLKASHLTEAPVRINDVAVTARKDFVLTVAPAPNGVFGGEADAITQSRDEGIFIVYNNDRADVRKRFSVAHELGHLYMGHLHGSSSIDLNSDNFDEIEANVFAANLLMPKTFLAKDIKAKLSPEQLIQKYGVSEEAFWYQITDAGLLNLLHKNL